MPSLIQEINIENVIDILTGIKITVKGKRRLQVGLDLLFTMMSSPVLQEKTRLEFRGDKIKRPTHLHHIYSVTSDKVSHSTIVWTRTVNS